MRLLRRTRVYVALFGAALASCRLLPPGAIVVQISGALKGEISPGALVSQVGHRPRRPPDRPTLPISPHAPRRRPATAPARPCVWPQYANVCNEDIGVKWVAYAAPGWRQPYPEAANNPDMMSARVPPAALAAVVARAIRALDDEAEYRALRREYLRSVNYTEHEGV